MTSLEVSSDDWRRAIRRRMLWLFALKLSLLTLLWALCFSSSHRYPVTAATTGQHLAVDGRDANSSPGGY